jgi:hypothetical protein
MTIAAALALANEAAWPVIVFLTPWLTRQVLKHMKDKDHHVIFQKAVDTAYCVVHQVSRKTENKIDDKVAEALKVVKDVLGRELTHEEKSKARSLLRAKHEGIKFPKLLGAISGIVGDKE